MNAAQLQTLDPAPADEPFVSGSSAPASRRSPSGACPRRTLARSLRRSTVDIVEVVGLLRHGCPAPTRAPDPR